MPSDIGGLGSNDTLWAIAPDPIESGRPGSDVRYQNAALDPIRPAMAEQPPMLGMPGEPSLPSASVLVASYDCLRSAGPIESGRSTRAHLTAPAALDPIADDLLKSDSLKGHVVGDPLDAGLQKDVAHTPCARVDPALTSAIRESWLRRQAWHRAEKSLTLQAKAICRRLVGGDKTLAEKLYKATVGKADHDLKGAAFLAIAPLVAARDAIEAERLGIEKHIVKLGAKTPLAEFVKATHGVGMLSLAGVIGEAGDLGLYANPAKLWKRMGLAVMPDGQRQRRVGGVEAMDHGYSPKRRSLVWTIGDCFVKAGGPYREVYDQRKAYEAARVDEEGKPFRPIVIHLRAKRYAEKRLLRDLWRHWRKESA